MCKLSVGREGEGDLSGVTRSGLSGEDIEAPSYVGDLSFLGLGILTFINSIITISTISHFPQLLLLFRKGKRKRKENSLHTYSLPTHSPRLLLLQNTTALKSRLIQHLLTSLDELAHNHPCICKS